MTDSRGDHIETEQKYDVDAGFTLPGLNRLPELGGAKATGPKRHFLTATYFDTEGLDLIRHKITLRRRVGGSDEGWHLKLPAGQDTRQEVHATLDEGAAGVVPARLAAEVKDVTAGERLRPIAILDTERAVVTVTGQDGQPLAEVADDRVTAIRFGDSEEPVTWREVEVEALSQDPAALRLAEAVGRVLRQAGARPSASGSKLARLLQS